MKYAEQYRQYLADGHNPISYQQWLENNLEIAEVQVRNRQRANARLETDFINASNALLELYRASRPIERSIGIASENMHHVFFAATGMAFGELEKYFPIEEIIKEYT